MALRLAFALTILMALTSADPLHKVEDLDTDEAMGEIASLRGSLLRLAEMELDDVSIEEAEAEDTHQRFKRVLTNQQTTECSCAALAAIATRVAEFESQIGLLGDVERKLELISASIKQLGLWISEIQQGPPGPPGSHGEPGPPGSSGDDGPPGQNTVMLNRGVPGPPGPMGARGMPGIKGIRGDCIQGEKGLRGDRGEAGISVPGDRGHPGDRGDLGIPGGAAGYVPPNSGYVINPPATYTQGYPAYDQQTYTGSAQSYPASYPAQTYPAAAQTYPAASQSYTGTAQAYPGVGYPASVQTYPSASQAYAPGYPDSAASSGYPYSSSSQTYPGYQTDYSVAVSYSGTPYSGAAQAPAPYPEYAADQAALQPAAPVALSSPKKKG